VDERTYVVNAQISIYDLGDLLDAEFPTTVITRLWAVSWSPNWAGYQRWGPR